uniref:LIM zinc-binding domain-containing protein n=1 Tax=Oryzias latipes TaxID=8090 RepID=A0A3P9I2B4_ORYLA
MSTSERFDCHYCKDSLLGKKYIMKEDTQYCTKCYENLFANCCEECSTPIGCNSKDLSYKDRHWHEQCFKCAKCSRSLADKAFAAREDLLLCTECYALDYSSKCITCKKTILPGSRKMEYKGNSWHETCFLCHRCQQPLGTKSFIPKENGYFCVPCFEKQFAYQCCACKKAITTGGVTYQDKPWHRECFLCIGCKRQLSGQRFTSRENYPYCLECFSNLYAKKCVGCTKPITSESQLKVTQSLGSFGSPYLCKSCQQLKKSNETKICQILCFVCLQVWQGLNISPLRSASGTASASIACSAPCHWWDVAFSPSAMTFCAQSVGGRSKISVISGSFSPLCTTKELQLFCNECCSFEDPL